MTETKFERITVNDNKVCSDCIELEDTPPATIEWWLQSGLMPREAPTACGKKCRCGLVPSTMEGIQAEVDRLVNKAVDEAMGKMEIDLTNGRRILLKDFENFKGIRTLQYDEIAYMEQKIYEWKIENNGNKLPNKFFNLNDLTKMTEWLEESLLDV